MHTDTHRLTRASLELSSRDERQRRTATLATVILTLLVAGGGAFYLREGGAAPFAASDVSTALSAENAVLRADLERVRTELDMEKATRAELNREAGELHARINELNNRLEFLAARDTRVDQPR
jgi:septal ring factor EnvC (AmiA/AmiB activator)